MVLHLTDTERGWLSDQSQPGRAMAMRIAVKAADLMGASELVPISHSHIDGCLYHGDSGVLFCERLAEQGARVSVPASLNVGALDLVHPELIGGNAARRAMARRLMDAHTAMGCLPTWTCAPYQVGHRPALGEQVAWGESNAVAFANSVLGARTNRYGDFLDICLAIVGRAPLSGLHVADNRCARVVVDVSGLSEALRRTDAFYPVLGAWLGRAVGATVAAIVGVPADVGEDDLKALGAGAASTGAVGLFHVVGVTPEAPDLVTALGDTEPVETIVVTAEMIRAARDALDTASGSAQLDCLAFGSPHFSHAEAKALETASAGMIFAVPVYVCTNRETLGRLEDEGVAEILRGRGVTFVVDTCVVVTPILKQQAGVMMTNSAKFAHYGEGNTGYATVFGGLADCVASAAAGRVVRDDSRWR